MPKPQPARPVRIVIAGEPPIFRDGLRRLLEADPGLKIVGETGESSESVDLLRDLTPDILLLGTQTAGGAPLETLERIKASGARVRTILLMGSVKTSDVMSALQLGACGVVPKDSAAEVLFKSIDSVMAGHRWVGGERVSNVASGVRRLDHTSRRMKAFGLTHRELEILRAVVSGHRNKAIARRFSISENTVKRHLTHIFNKVGASNRVELALFTAHHRLLDLI